MAKTKTQLKEEALAAHVAAFNEAIARVSLPIEHSARVTGSHAGSGTGRQFQFSVRVRVPHPMLRAEYEFVRMMDDAREVGPGLCDGDHALYLQGVRYSADADAPKDVRLAAESVFSAIRPVL